MSQAFDLSAMQASTLDESALTIINPKTGQDTPMKVTLLSPDSAEYKRRVNRLQEQEARRRKLRREITPEEAEASVRSKLRAPTSTASPWAARRTRCGGSIRPSRGFWTR